ncbi:MAG: lysylphosphatidylglycerol synthase transmembrane domain-containing protein [Saprospiraceae bacterium]|nr:flippase-like domain-containing protein [Saprospiraceae bacterium]MBK9993039.1 flippase-like domain-containing protein [Saprospiraceae bacterium]
MSKYLKSILQFIIFTALGLGIFYWIYNSQNASYQIYCSQNNIPSSDCSLIDKVAKDFGRVNWFYIALIFVSFVLSNVFRAFRWQMIFESMGNKIHFVNSLGSIFTAYFANLGIPRSGELVRAGFISKYEDIPVDKSFGTIVLDRIVDMSSMCALLVLTVFLQRNVFISFYNQYLSGTSLFQKFIPFIIIGVVGIILIATKKIWLQWNLVQKIFSKLQGFWSGISSIRNMKKPWLFLFHTIMVWTFFYLMLFFALKSFPPTASIPPSAGLAIYVFGAMGMIIPTPGGVGSYHYLTMLGLSYYGINEIDAFSFSNIAFFSAQFATNILLGIIALIVLPIFNANYTKSELVK